MRTLVLLSILLLSSTVRAESVGVVVTGEPTMQPQLVKQLETWLKKHGHQLVPAPLQPDAINTLIDCFVIEDEGCARALIEKRAKANAVVYARVDVQAGGDLEKTVTVSAYWFEKGQPAVAERRFCQRCNDTALRSTAEDLISALAKAGHKKGNGKLKLSSNPPGAKVVVDNKDVGVTPLEHDVLAGPHEVVIGNGSDAETRFVEVKPGDTIPVDVALKSKASGKTMLPVGAMAIGAALVVTGVVMLAVDQDRRPDQPPEINNTAPLGVGLAIGGLAVAAGGFAWWRMTGKRESAPVATVGPHGAVIGWAGRF
jgi:hypothetical protein